MHFATMMAHGDGDDDLPPGPPIWGPPDNEVPAVLAGPRLLNRSDDGALLLLSMRVFSVGVEISLGFRLRTSADAPVPETYPRWSAMLVGVELGDGRRVVCDDGFAGLANGSVPCLTNRGGGGGGRAYESTWWLSPAPPDGHLVLHTACLPLGLAESSYPIDAPTLAAARAAIVELWPWEPESEHAMLEPTTKELPAGGWFEETAARG